MFKEWGTYNCFEYALGLTEFPYIIDDNHLPEAEDWINKAIEMDKRNGMMWHLGQDYSSCAELFKRKDDQSKTKENLNRAIETFKECGADGWVEENEKELAALS